MDDRQSLRCLICTEKCAELQPYGNTFPFLSGAEGNTSTNSQLWSLFVLQNVLQYPQENISGLLKDTYGLNPSDWFVLCSDCCAIIIKTMEIYQKLLIVEDELKYFQRKAKRKIQESFQHNNDIKEVANVFCVRTKIRQYFSNALQSITSIENPAFKKEPETDWGQFPSSPEIQEKDYDNNSTSSFISNNDKPNFNKESIEQKGNKFYCDICTCRRLYTTRDSLMKHLWRHRNHKYPCSKCKFPCETEKALRIHLQRNLCNESNELKCEQCDFVAVLKMDLEKHRLELHQISVSSLKVNPAVSKKRSQGQSSTLKKQHNHKIVKVEKDRKVLACNVCSFKTKKRQTLNLHLKRHEFFENLEKIDGKLKCKLCDDLFPTRLYLIRHVRQVHGNETAFPSFTCSSCGTNFGDLHSLNSHIACVHTQQCKYFCDKCGMRFVSKSVMERHILSHGNDKTFICDLCGASLKSDASLKMHIKKVHRSSSNVGREYTCKFCEEGAFLNKSILNRHVREKHKDLYVYKCEECENSYLSQASLQLHMKVKHGDDPAECQFCQKKVLNKVYLGAHYQKYCRKKPVDFKFELSK